MSARDQDLLPEPELVELFRPRRPEPESFNEGVARRIEEKRRARPQAQARRIVEEPDLRSDTSWWQRAAAFFFVGPSTTSLGLVKGKSVHALSTVLALPALLMGSAISASAAAARSIRRSGREALVPGETSLSGRAAWRSNRELRLGSRVLSVVQFGGSMAFLLSWAFGGERMVDGMLVLLLISMAALVLTVRGLSRAGLLFRSAIAAHCTGLLAAVFVGCLLWSTFAGGLHVQTRGPGIQWSFAVMALGMALCLVSSRETRPGLFVLIAFAPIGFLLIWLQPVPNPGARHQLGELELAPGDLKDWGNAVALFEAVESTGAEPPDLASVAMALERAEKAGQDVHPLIWTSAARMGLVGRETWCGLADRKPEAYGLRQLQGDALVMNGETYEYRYHMLSATRPLSEAELERLVARVEDDWPQPESFGPSTLGRAASCLRVFDLLGRSDLAESKRAAAHELLRTHWIGRPGRSGFTADPSKFDEILDEATWNGMQLMRRFGAPPEVDLQALHASLSLRSQGIRADVPVHAGYAALPRASLEVLDHWIGLPPRTPLEQLLDARLLITLTLLVALCLLAIAQTPPEARLRRGVAP